MLIDFLQSWPMFQESYMTALLSGGLLSLLGVLVVARDEIFLAAAVAQASVLGVALALMFGWQQPAILAVSLSVIAALATSGRLRRNGAGREEITAWTFLAAASLAVLVLSQSPVGMKNVQSVLTSTILGASRVEVALFAGLALAATVFVFWNASRLVLLVIDPVMAAAVGMSVSLWSLALSATLGLVSGLAIRTTGLLFTFGCLVLPALIAKNLCMRVKPMFCVAPIIGLAGVLFGLMLAHQHNFPPGQVIVALLAAILVLAWVWRKFRQRLISA